MVKGLATALLCGFVIAVQIRAQEVVVARETKPEAPKQAAPTSERAERESRAPAESTPRVREKKSASAVPTVEQMRMAGALAAERLTKGTIQQPSMSDASSPPRERGSERTPNVSGTVKPVETRAEKTSASRESKSRSTKSEEVAPVRPTMMESGREERPTPSPTKAESRGEQSPAPQSANQSRRKQGTILSRLLSRPPREEDTSVP